MDEQAPATPAKPSFPNPWRFTRLGKGKPRPASRLGAASFDEEIENRFWLERNAETRRPLQAALLLGAAGFAVFVWLDAATRGLSWPALLARCLVIFGLIGLYAWMRRPSSKPSNGKIAVAAVTISVVNLTVTLLLENDPAGYATAWPGLLPIYFFIYGQMVMSLAASLLFGWAAMIAMFFTGGWVGVDAATLLASLFILTLVNLFGLCTRCQLEAYSRHSFRQRLAVERNAEDKASFLRQTSHNLRQPLQALGCYASVLDADLANNRLAEARQTAGKLGYAIDELNDAFNRILDIANLDSGRHQPSLAGVEINPLLAALEAQFAPRAAQRGLKLKVVPRSQPPHLVHSDAVMLQQILGNLVDNAIKYTAEGWIMVATVKTGADRLKFHVRDSGIGIAAEERESIFQEFYRSQRRPNDYSAPGLGIGLSYVSKALQQLPDHTLSIRSRPNRGSDFLLDLPCREAVPAPPLANGLPDLAGSFVLLADHDEAVLRALASQLRYWGCLVEQASSLAEVRLALAENFRQPDLLITDFCLGQEHTAHDVIAALQADCGPVPTVILSARSIADADQARLPQATQLLRKPASAVALLEAMGRAMGKLDGGKAAE